MNENPSSNESAIPPASLPAENKEPEAKTAAPVSEKQSASEKPSKASNSQAVPYILIVALAAALGAGWWSMQSEISSLRQEVTRRLHAGEGVANETRETAKAVQGQLQQLQAKVNGLENKQLEAQGQWAAIEQLYQDLSKTRDDWVLAEIEQVLSTASQQLQLAGNVRGALIALQNADAKLAQYENAQFVIIRRAIARDLEVLQSLPAVDLSSIALRLDSAIARIDTMPLLSDEKPSVPITEQKVQRFTGNAPGEAEADTTEGRLNEWLARAERAWDSLTHELWMEVRQIVQVRRVDTPDALLMSPSHAYFARENLKLRLLNARQALLARNETAFRNDMSAAQDAISKYFDTHAKQTQTVQELLKQIQASNLVIEMPTLADSLNAIRTHKTKQ